mgnify:CR=1 FL=1
MVWGEARGVKLFQSTLPVRGATGETVVDLFMGSDFNPRSP